MNLLDIFESDFARDKWNKASDEREAAANQREAEMTARHRQGKEDMSGAIDRLEKHMNTPVNEKLKGLPKKLGSARDLGKSVRKFRAARGLEEGAMKEWLWKEAEGLERDAFVANAAEYGMTDEEAAEWWDSINGLDEAGIGQDIVNRTEKMARATPQTKTGAVASTVKNAAKWLAGKGGPGREGPTYEGANDIEDRGEYDREGDMAKDNIHTIVRNARELESVIGDNDNLPEWVQDKLANIKGMMTAVSEYMQTQHEREGVVPEGTETQWSKESPWTNIPKSKSGQPVDPRGEVAHMSDVAQRQTEQLPTQEEWMAKVKAKYPTVRFIGEKMPGGAMHADVPGVGRVASYPRTAPFGRVGSTTFPEPRKATPDELRFGRAALKSEKLNPADGMVYQFADPRANSQKKINEITSDQVAILQREQERRMLSSIFGSDPDSIAQQNAIRQQDREYELGAGTEKRLELKRKADEIAEIKREKLRNERVEDEENAFRRAETVAQRKAEMEKIRLAYDQELRVINTEHRNNLEIVKTGNTHEIQKLNMEYAQADKDRVERNSSRDKDRRQQRDIEGDKRDAERYAARQAADAAASSAGQTSQASQSNSPRPGPAGNNVVPAQTRPMQSRPMRDMGRAQEVRPALNKPNFPRLAKESQKKNSKDVEEGYQDFNKVEPYAVCLAGKPVKKFDYYEQARRFHDNWKQKLYREGNMAKAEKITLMPLNLDEAGSPAQQAAIAIAMKKAGKKPKQVDEDQWDSGEDVTVTQDDQSTTYQYKGCKFVVNGEEAQGEAWWYEPGDTWRDADHYTYEYDEARGIDRFYDNSGQNVFNLSATNQNKVEQFVKAKAKDFVSTMAAQPNLSTMHEAKDRVDPILYKALDRMQPGIAGQGQPGDDLFSAARTALATEWGLMALRSEYATATAYTRQLIDLYLAKHGAKQGVAEGNPNSDPWYVYAKQNPKNFKKFKTYDAAKAYADKHGLTCASAGHFHDKVKEGIVASGPSRPLDDRAVRKMVWDTMKINADTGEQALQRALAVLAKKPQSRMVQDLQDKFQNLSNRLAQGLVETTDVKSGMAKIYNKLAPKIERHRDSFLAGQLYDELENYAELHGAEDEFKRMMNGARNRAHMEYDTNPGGFQNWFWFLPFGDEIEEGMYDTLGEDQDTGAVESAIIRRIMVAHVDWLQQFGPEKVMQAAEEVAYNVGDVDEIGTSDVSAYVHEVGQILGVEA